MCLFKEIKISKLYYMNIFNFDNQTFTLTNYGTKDNIYFKAIEIAQFLG